MKNLLLTLVRSLGEVLDWLATDPTVKAVMPREMYGLTEQYQCDE
ncbi:MAG: hypothetical protein WBB01_21650 [Phormidesmis sp.]